MALQAALGALAMFGYLALGVAAIARGVPVGTAALISALQPIATAALAGPLLGERVTGRQWLGLLLGLGGIAAAVGGGTGQAPPAAYLLSLASMASLVAATLLAKAAPTAMPAPVAAARWGVSGERLASVIGWRNEAMDRPRLAAWIQETFVTTGLMVMPQAVQEPTVGSVALQGAPGKTAQMRLIRILEAARVRVTDKLAGLVAQLEVPFTQVLRDLRGLLEKHR